MELVRSFMDFLSRERSFRNTRRRLHELDDRLLRDIGVRRDQIDSLALEMRENARKQSVAKAQNRRGEKSHRGTFGGRGLAAQH